MFRQKCHLKDLSRKVKKNKHCPDLFKVFAKKGQNNKIINLHDKTVIYTSRFVLIHQDLHKYIKIHICTLRIVSLNINQAM